MKVKKKTLKECVAFMKMSRKIELKREEPIECPLKECLECQIPFLLQLYGWLPCLFSPQQKSVVLLSGQISELQMPSTNPNSNPNPNL